MYHYISKPHPHSSEPAKQFRPLHVQRAGVHEYVGDGKSDGLGLFVLAFLVLFARNKKNDGLGLFVRALLALLLRLGKGRTVKKKK